MMLLAVMGLAICLSLTHYALYTVPLAPVVFTWQGRVRIASTMIVRLTLHIILTGAILLIYSQLGYLQKLEDYYNYKQHATTISYLAETITDIGSLTKTIEQRIKKNPSDYHAKYLLSNLYKKQHFFTRAHHLLQEVVQAAPHNVTYSSALLEMEFHHKQELSEYSIDIAKRHLNQQCDSHILSMLTISLYKKQRYYEARRFAKKLQNHLSPDSEAYGAAVQLGKKIQKKIASLPVEAPE
jgi:tetratricopeptide (TPR) repeat protein